MLLCVCLGGVGYSQDGTRIERLEQEVQLLRQRLEQLEQELRTLREYQEEQSQELIPALQGRIDELSRTAPANYFQFQWFDSQENRANEGFAMRRVRISQTNWLDERMRIRWSFDVASGAQRIDAELRDAQLIWDIEPTRERVGVQLLAGQQRLPLGYELERSSTERELPERTLYNRTMFAGERGRGLFVRYGLSENSFAHFGLWNNLTVADPQQVDANTFGDLSRRLAWHAGVRYYTERVELGIAGFVGHRASFRYTDSNGDAVAVPAVQREYLYLDGAVLDFLTRNLTLRAELMFGRDRVPTGGARAPRYRQRTDILGYHGQLTFRFTPRNYLTVRYERFDPAMQTLGDETQIWGVAYNYFINPKARLTLCYEWLGEEGAEQPNNQFILRLQYRY
ncbi:MAG: hypothetical protein KatS3mg020_0723 [Fimbriimonadales bacterium]|nr:MAG: hypothetical protein KatS3mg020_0723 [Fimbriimonadales bacterium]